VRSGPGQGHEQVGRHRVEPTRPDHDVGVLDHRAEHLAQAAAVVDRGVPATFGEEGVAEEVVDHVGPAHRRHHAHDAQVSLQVGVLRDHGAHLGRLGAGRQVRDDALPPPLLREPQQGGQHVLAHRTRDTRVGEPDLGPVHQPGQVADRALQELLLYVDVVANCHGVRQVELQGHQRRRGRLRVDSGDQDDRCRHARSSW
jgi:hypothetical protein